MQNVKVNKPCTVYIRFAGEMPRRFILYKANGDPYYFRYLNGKTPRVKFNVPDLGDYFTSVPVEVLKQREIEIPVNLPSLPKPERDRVHSYEFVVNPDYDGIAKNYSNLGIIEFGQKWISMTDPMKLFIMLHEKWHSFYFTEQYCDFAAGVDFLRMGYNRSTGAYTLKTMLSDTPENRQRVDDFNNFLQQTQKNEL